MLAMVRNFDAGVVGADIFNVNHQPGGGAAAKVCKLAVEGGRLGALGGVDQLWPRLGKARGFRYFSAEFSKNWLERWVASSAVQRPKAKPHS